MNFFVSCIILLLSYVNLRTLYENIFIISQIFSVAPKWNSVWFDWCKHGLLTMHNWIERHFYNVFELNTIYRIGILINNLKFSVNLFLLCCKDTEPLYHFLCTHFFPVSIHYLHYCYLLHVFWSVCLTKWHCLVWQFTELLKSWG